MSTSDAGELDLRVVGGETSPPLYSATRATRTTTAREQQNETFDKRSRQENHHGDETLTRQRCRPSSIRQEQPHKAPILRAGRLRQEEAAHCANSKTHTGPKYTSCIFFRLSRNLSLDNTELRPKKNLDHSPHSLTETQRAETKNSSCQVNGRTSPPDTSTVVTSGSPASERIPAKKKEVIKVVSNELETTRNLSISNGESNGEFGPHDCNGLCEHPCESQLRTITRSVKLEENIKDNTKPDKQSDLVEPGNPGGTMLSSTVVTVLAPHWSGRLRRNKRFEGNGNSEAQGNLQDVTNTAGNRQERFQETMNRSLTDGSQAQLRVPLLGTRRNTVGCASTSKPANLDYESKRTMIQAMSLDVNTGRMDNRKRDTGALSPVATATSPVSPLSLKPNEQRRNPHDSPQGGLSSLSSKPTTSSLLLSLRRFNSNGRNSTSTGSTIAETNPSPLSCSPSDRDGKIFTTQLSQTFNKNIEQERSKPLLSPLPMSYRTTETGSILSPSSNQRERTTFETRFFSASPTNKDAADAPFTQQPQTTNRTHSSPLCSKHAFLSRGQSENCRAPDKHLYSESSMSSPRHSPYDRSTLLKTHSYPRRTTLTSTSWWKQVSQEGSSPPTLSDTTNIKDKLNTPVAPPCNDKSDLASPSPTDNKRFSCQFPNNRDNNNITESDLKGNMNLVVKTHGGSHNLKQRNAEASPDHDTDRLVKQQCGSNLNIRDPQKPQSLTSVLSSSKISRAPVQTKLSHPKDLPKHDVSNTLFAAKVSELPPTLLNLKSSNTPTESNNKYNNNHCTSKTNSTSMSPHNKDTQRFTKPALSLATTNTLISQAQTSGLPLTTNTSSSFQPVASQANTHASSYTGSSSQTPKFTTTAITTPLGFERSYASVPKPFNPVSSLIPTVNTFPKTNYSPVSTASTISSFTTGSHPAGTTAPNSSLVTPPVTPSLLPSPIVTVSSLLTPPATPIITSPNYLDTSSPKEERTFSSNQEKDTKKQRPHAEGKRVRRVTWEDSVDLPRSDPIKDVKPEPSSSPSPSRSPRSIKAPSIFSFLRSSSPTTNTSPRCSPTPKTSSIQVVKGEKYRSLSSDYADLPSREQERIKQRPSDNMIFDQGRQELMTPRQERTLSVESGTVQFRSSTPLSLPPDFSSGYKLRYSSPPYSTLMHTRSTQGEIKAIPPRSALFHHPSQSNYTPNLSIHTDPVSGVTLPTSRPPLSPVSLPQPLSLPFQNKTNTRETFGFSETDQLNNNDGKNNKQDHQNGSLLFVNNRIHISSQSLQGDKTNSSSSTFVTETLVYSIKSKVDTATATQNNTTTKPLQYVTNTPVPVEAKLVQSKDVAGDSRSHSGQSSSGSSSTESPLPDDESSIRRTKESVLGKSRFFSVESNNEQSPKKSRFALKKSVSTPNASLSRSESDRASKTNNKMDQVLNRLRQTFSTRRSEDDMSFPWKWKKASQTPSVSGSSDISNVSDLTVDSSKNLEKQEQEKGVVVMDNEKGTDVIDRWKQNRYTLSPKSASGSTLADKLYIWSDRSTPETEQDKHIVCAEHSPTMTQFDFYKDETDYKSSNQFLSCRDPNPGRSPNPSVTYPTQYGKSTPSPRSPFSPFSSLSPLSSFPSPDAIDDSVFYSPKLQRRRESPSPCEPGEGISLGGSRRSRVSTGPPSTSPGPDTDCLASSYADLKYGIEPGKSFSVSSVLSSRPSGPGRISTGSRFMSVGDLSKSALTGGGTSEDLDHWSVYPDCQPIKDCQMSYLLCDPGKMRSRSLPRSLTRRLANWSSGISAPPPVNTTNSKSAQHWSPDMNICHFAWDIEGPPTPPPTPPLSPVSRRISKPPSLSSPTFPSSPGAPQQGDSQSSRGHLPSRCYVSSLSTFDESSDRSSDTTTDDEYYLETGEDEEKETEL